MTYSSKTKRVAFRPALGETRLEERIAPTAISPAAVARVTPAYQLPGQNTGSLTSPQLRTTPAYQLPGQNTGSLTAPQVRALATPGAYQLPGQHTGSLTTPQVRGFFHR